MCVCARQTASQSPRQEENLRGQMSKNNTAAEICKQPSGRAPPPRATESRQHAQVMPSAATAASQITTGTGEKGTRGNLEESDRRKIHQTRLTEMRIIAIMLDGDAEQQWGHCVMNSKSSCGMNMGGSVALWWRGKGKGDWLRLLCISFR